MRSSLLPGVPALHAADGEKETAAMTTQHWPALRDGRLLGESAGDPERGRWLLCWGKTPGSLRTVVGP